jgi:adenylosuccinate lyase
VERVIAPDATVALDFALVRLAELIDRLVVYPERMKANLDRLGGLVHSQRVLLALTAKGMSRDAAYEAVQRNAMRAWSDGGDFLALLKQDPEIAKRLTESELEGLFELAYHLKNVDLIFRRVFGVEPSA